MAYSTLTEFRNVEARIAELQAKLASMEKDVEGDRLIQAEIDDVLARNGKTPKYLLELYELNPISSSSASGKAAKIRRPRMVKVYTNPHTQEVIETKGGNHAGLKVWKDEHGAEVVATWAQQAV